MPLNTPLFQSESRVALGFGACVLGSMTWMEARFVPPTESRFPLGLSPPSTPRLDASHFAHRPLEKKLHENNAKTGIFCNIMKNNLILAHSVTCATPKKAILNGSFYFLDSILCFEFLPFFF